MGSVHLTIPRFVVRVLGDIAAAITSIILIRSTSVSIGIAGIERTGRLSTLSTLTRVHATVGRIGMQPLSAVCFGTRRPRLQQQLVSLLT